MKYKYYLAIIEDGKRFKLRQQLINYNEQDLGIEIPEKLATFILKEFGLFWQEDFQTWEWTKSIDI